MLNKLVIESDRMVCLLLLRVCLLLFLQFLEEAGKAARLRMGEVILLAEIQIIAQPLKAGCMGIIRDGLLPQERHKLRLQC
jgi:hypothetical protein